MEHTKAYQEFKKNGNTKFVRYSEGAEMYHMSVSKFMQIAKDAKAIYKLGQLVLVNLKIFDEYIETYFAIIKAEIEDFVDKVYNSIREFGYNLKTTPIVFVGGGAVVMKNFGSHDARNISYNLDVKANARGYEQLATMGLKSTKRLS